MEDKAIFDNIVDKAKNIMPKIMDKVPEIDMDTRLNLDGFESLNFIMLICEIENDYGITIPDRTWNKLRTVGDVVRAVKIALKKKA